uniref:Uncharacterized protein n=1 Tax=Eutreptiella gymnastica TaxID=73025 RepID=A0A7S1NSQ9_9EUGL
MFDRAYCILEKERKGTTFEMQFAVYRNYNSCAEEILQHSAWETRPGGLYDFMSIIGPDRGWFNEAVEIGLWHVNREIANGGVDQVVLIADMPPNSLTEVQYKREEKGESYWGLTNFKTPTFWETELGYIKDAGIPVHAFYVSAEAQPVFQTIAAETGGMCAALDIYSPAGAEMLTNIVTERILHSVGGDTLVTAYRDEFCRGHVAAC